MKTGRNAPCACGSGKKSKHCCQALGERRPSAPPAELNQLIALFHAGRYAEMESRSRLLVERYPDSGIAWKLYGTALGVQGRDALSALQKASALLPEDVEIHINLGNVLQDLGQVDSAILSYRRALGLNPQIAEVHNNLGNALKELGQLDAAMASYRHALNINPRYAEAHNNLGVALQALGRFDDAASSIRRALEIHPGFAEAHNNLGNALKGLGQLDAALACFRQSLAIQPDSAEAHNNLGAALEALGQSDDAVESFRRALEIAPDFAKAHSNLAHVLLALGDFERGWQEYAWRHSRDAANVPLPEANALLPFTSAGKRILLCFEQGIGDELFFLQFAPQLCEQAQWVGYWSTPKVHSLIERAGCVDQVFSRLDEAPSRDLIIPVGDLPLLLACNSIEAIPSSLRLSPTDQHVAKVRQRLNELGLAGQRLLGVTWRGGSPPVPGKPKMLFKQIGLDLLADAIKDWDGAIVVLQRAPAAGEIEQLRASVSCPVYDLSDYNDDLESMLALLDALDEYAGVSNANMHLMAGLGKTARVLIPFPAEWRWMASGDQSPWFPGFALYRQTITGDWGQALAGISRDLCCGGDIAPLIPPPTEFNHLITLFNSGHYAEMENGARLQLEQFPESGLGWKLLCASLQMQGKDALSALQMAAKLLPDDAEAHNNLGNALQDIGQPDGAVASYRRALEINPDDAEVLNNLGTALQDLQQLDDAVASYRKALKINPDYAEGHNNLGNALQDLGQLDGAVVSYRQALEIKPDYAEAHNNLAHVLLELGDFEHGWQEYEWRDARRAVERRTPAPLANAKSLLPFTSQGKRILLCYEQGIGDELFLLRFAPQLKEKAQWVGYWSTAKVHSVVERSGCVDQVFSRFDEAPPTDLILPIGDIPLLLGCYSTAAIPPSLRFPRTEQHLAKVRQRLKELGLAGQRLLGVTWRGGSPPVPGKIKSLFKQIELDALAGAIKDWKGTIVVLQRNPAAGEIEQLRASVSCPVQDLSDFNDDLESMLALLDVLDEYAGVSNANMHLMAGLGKTARVLIPFPAEWRWMASGEQSPWFPGFALYRQTITGDWGQALAGLTRDIAGS